MPLHFSSPSYATGLHVEITKGLLIITLIYYHGLAHLHAIFYYPNTKYRGYWVLSGNVLHREMQYKVHCIIYHMYQVILIPLKNRVYQDVCALLKLALGYFGKIPPAVFFFFCPLKRKKKCAPF